MPVQNRRHPTTTESSGSFWRIPTSAYHVYRTWENTRDLPIFIPWLRSLKTPETPGLSITFGTLSTCRSFKTKDYWTFSHCFYRISFSSRVYMYALGMRLNVTGKANHSRQNSLTAKAKSVTLKANRSQQKQINSERDIFIVEVSVFSKCCYSS